MREPHANTVSELYQKPPATSVGGFVVYAALVSSRRTFRRPARDVAYQRQLRDEHNDEGLPPGLDADTLQLKSSRVRAVSRALAKQVILKYEWLGTMSHTGYHFGLFYGEWCAGVVCFAVGGGATGGSNVHKEWQLEPRQLATLARGACVHWAPRGSNSRLIAHAVKQLRAATGAKLVLAYSDTDAGEIGTVYQAAGWAYVGRGSSTNQLIATNGRIYDQKQVSNYRKAHNPQLSWRAQRDALLAAGWREQPTNPKHRYVLVLDRDDAELVALVESKRLPYPKRLRAVAASSDAAVYQTVEGDSQSTPPLHSTTAAR